MSTMAIADEESARAPRGSLGVLALGALGVVYGDIGTSPLYTMKTALDWCGGATPEVAVGMLSLIVWMLLITTSIKYVAVVMRADNDGEGGILALMSLRGIKHNNRSCVIAIGVLGAALLAANAPGISRPGDQPTPFPPA
jgi:KUP system potassium uptake protein